MNIKKSVFVLTLCAVSMPGALSSNDQKKKSMSNKVKGTVKKILPTIDKAVRSEAGAALASSVLQDGKINKKDLVQFGLALLGASIAKDALQQPAKDTTPVTPQEQLTPQAQEIINALDNKQAVPSDIVLSLKEYLSSDVENGKIDNLASPGQSTTSQNQKEEQLKSQIQQLKQENEQLNLKLEEMKQCNISNESELEGAAQDQVRDFDETNIPQNRDTSDDASSTDTSINEADQFMASDGTKGDLPKPVYDDATLMNADTTS